MRIFFRAFEAMTFVAVMLFLSHCGGSSSFSSSSSDSSLDADSGTTTTAAVGGNVNAVTITSGTNIDLSGLTGDAMMMFYSYSTSSSSASLQLSSLNDSTTSFLMSANSFEEDDLESATEEFHGDLRDWENLLDESALLEEGSGSKYLVRLATEGDQKNFKVLNSFSSSSSYDTVTATLMVQTQYFNFYVDNRNLNAISSSNLESMASDFEGVISLERELFGTESDVNGDGRFDVLFTQTVNQLGGSSGGMVTGFFYAVDLFDSDVYSISNEQEVFFTFVPDPNGSYGSAVSESFAVSNIYRGVLSHEYQHMISFNMHYNVNGGSSEEGWLNEGLSHLAEDIYSADENGYMTTTGLENPARVSGYLSRVSSLCFTCGTSLYQRGGSYLFVRYLYEQAEQGAFSTVASGKEFLNDMLNTNSRGKDNVVEVIYGSSASSSDFKNIMGLFGLAMYLSDTDLSSDSRFNFTGINLRSAQDDNRGTYLNGPATQSLTAFPFSDTLTGNSFVFLNIDQNTAADQSSVTVSTSSGSDFGGYLVQE